MIIDPPYRALDARRVRRGESPLTTDKTATMTRRRFYIPTLCEGPAVLGDEDARHARKVLRLETGDTVEVFDGVGNVATGRIGPMGREVSLEILERRAVPPLCPVVDLAVAFPKGSRADVLAEKASELGADCLIPLLTERTVVEPRENKLHRMERVAVESAKQCGRAWVMRIEEPTELAKLLAEANHDVKLIADTAEGVQVLPTLSAANRVIVLIGPEGGWSDSERLAAKSAGFAAWRLGPNVLRVETAAMAALAILRRHS